MKVWVLNGPNLGRLDLRDHSIYGDISFKDLTDFCIRRITEPIGIEQPSFEVLAPPLACSHILHL